MSRRPACNHAWRLFLICNEDAVLLYGIGPEGVPGHRALCRVRLSAVFSWLDAHRAVYSAHAFALVPDDAISAARRLDVRGGANLGMVMIVDSRCAGSGRSVVCARLIQWLLALVVIAFPRAVLAKDVTVAVYVEGADAAAIRNTLLVNVPAGTTVAESYTFSAALSQHGQKVPFGKSLEGDARDRTITKVRTALASSGLDGAVIARAIKEKTQRLVKPLYVGAGHNDSAKSDEISLTPPSGPKTTRANSRRSSIRLSRRPSRTPPPRRPRRRPRRRPQNPRQQPQRPRPLPRRRALATSLPQDRRRRTRRRITRAGRSARTSSKWKSAPKARAQLFVQSEHPGDAARVLRVSRGDAGGERRGLPIRRFERIS